MLGQADGLRIARRHVEHSGELLPQIAPAEIVAVGDVERFQAAARLGDRPQRGVGEVRGLRDLVDRPVGSRLAGEAQRQPELLADGGIDRDCRSEELHRRARRETAKRLRPQLHPVPALAALVSGEPVDLIEIVVGRQVARIVLAHRCPERSEMRAVVLGARHQHDAAQHARGPIDRGHGVDQHVAIGSDVGGVAGGRSGRRLKGGVEDVRRLREVRERVGGSAAVEEVDADVAIARSRGRPAAGQPDHGPVGLRKQPFDDVVPDDAERSHHDGLPAFSHSCTPAARLFRRCGR